MPVELSEMLKKDSKAKKFFEAFSPSNKKSIYRWILKGKLEATRQKRVMHVVTKAREGSRDVI